MDRRTHTQPSAELVLRAKAGEVEARDALIGELTPLVASVARMYWGSAAVSRGELMQDGVVGLLRALERYDPALGTPFWAYARWWVRQAMQQLVAELARPVVLSDRAARELARVKTARRSHLQSHRREPSSRELAASTGLDRAQVEDLMAAERSPRGLEGGTSADVLADQRAEEAFERVPRRLSRAELAGMLGGLPHREYEIVRARFGLDGRERRTLRELGGELGLSAERVRQIEERALERLRETVEA